MKPEHVTNKEQREKKLTPRVTLRIAITLEGKDPFGNQYQENTHTENVSKNGARILTRYNLRVGDHLMVKAFGSKFHSQASVTRLYERQEDGFLRVGIRFLNPAGDWIVK